MGEGGGLGNVKQGKLGLILISLKNLRLPKMADLAFGLRPKEENLCIKVFFYENKNLQKFKVS